MIGPVKVVFARALSSNRFLETTCVQQQAFDQRRNSGKNSGPVVKRPGLSAVMRGILLAVAFVSPVVNRREAALLEIVNRFLDNITDAF
jgi:hypothetical protein